MYLRYYLHGISNISTPGYRRVVRGLRRVRLLRPPRVRTRQLRLQVATLSSQIFLEGNVKHCNFKFSFAGDNFLSKFK